MKVTSTSTAWLIKNTPQQSVSAYINIHEIQHSSEKGMLVQMRFTKTDANYLIEQKTTMLAETGTRF